MLAKMPACRFSISARPWNTLPTMLMKSASGAKSLLHAAASCRFQASVCAATNWRIAASSWFRTTSAWTTGTSTSDTSTARNCALGNSNGMDNLPGAA
jgi:hypothetical protein